MTEHGFTAELRSHLIGQQVTEIEWLENMWAFRFGPVTLTIDSPWRVVASGRIYVTDLDHQQMFGLPAPVDAAERALSRMTGPVTSVWIHPVTADIQISFGTDVHFDVWTHSAGYESWHFFLPNGVEAHALGGGRIHILRDSQKT